MNRECAKEMWNSVFSQWLSRIEQPDPRLLYKIPLQGADLIYQNQDRSRITVRTEMDKAEYADMLVVTEPCLVAVSHGLPESEWVDTCFIDWNRIVSIKVRPIPHRERK